MAENTLWASWLNNSNSDLTDAEQVLAEADLEIVSLVVPA